MIKLKAKIKNHLLVYILLLYFFVFCDKETSIGPDVQITKVPTFETGKKIKINDQYLKVGMTAAPCIVDWNEDGKDDLLVGCLNKNEGLFNPYCDRVELFLNSGSNSNPVFKSSERYQIYRGDYFSLSVYG